MYFNNKTLCNKLDIQNNTVISPCVVYKINVLSEFKINTDLFATRSFRFKASND